ncbi:MAG: reverse transcriptase domain-containing protein, partial [Gaiellaceae bacterium]
MEPIQSIPPVQLTGIAKGLQVLGKGKVRWTVKDTAGQLRNLEHFAYYVPECAPRLLCPQAYMKHLKGLGPEYAEVRTAFNDDEYRITNLPHADIDVPLNPMNNLWVSAGYNASVVERRACELNLCVTHADNQNLSEPQKELLRWHFRLGHLHFDAIKLLFRRGSLASSEAQRQLHRRAALCEPPKCASCQFGKAKRRPAPGTNRTPDLNREGALKRDNLLPGQCVSVDHFVSSTKGRLYTSMGKSSSTTMYSGGCIFVDHSSGYVHVEHQVATTSHETLESKHKFERMCFDNGVTVQTYLSDNGRAFRNKEFADELRTFKQVSRFAGVGAHHHNGVAERNIQTIMSMARTMMLHAAIRWPETADTAHWPMAVDYAVEIFNHLPNTKSGLAPIDVFTGSKWPATKCHDFHVWGSPAYVLDAKLADGKKIPRWKPRSRRAVFLGHSPQHATSIPLVLNLLTGSLSGQFHVVFDDWFTTISTPESAIDPHSEPWSNLFGESRFQYVFDDGDPVPGLHDEWLVDEDDAKRRQQVLDRLDKVAAAQRNVYEQPISYVQPPMVPTVHAPTLPTTPSVNADHGGLLSGSPTDPPPTPLEPSTAPTAAPREETPLPRETTVESREPTRESTPPTPRRVSWASPLPPHRRVTSPKKLAKAIAAPVRRSERTTKGLPPERLIELNYHSMDCILDGSMQDIGAYLAEAYPAATNDPDTLSYDEAMASPDREHYLAAMAEEISGLQRQGTWSVIKKAEASGKILPGTWTFRRKRRPDGTIKKYKARYCVRGDLQEKVEDSWAPVAMWSTVRLVMFFSLFFRYHTRCIDFSNAFVQAVLNDPIFIHLPRGYYSTTGDDVCLKLHKSLYGITQAPKLWYEHLTGALMRRGFTQSRLDPCLFYRGSIILVIYVDDCLLASKDDADLVKLIAELKEDFDLTEEGEISEYLGINVARQEQRFVLTQGGLIDRVISATGLKDCKENWTPAHIAPLGKDEHLPAFDESWSYASVVGMLMYLANNSRPDIAFAVNQCARFTHNPRSSHAKAVKMIVRYLAKTRTEGLTLEPSGTLSVDCHVDADFAGLWKREDDQDPLCVKSRTG